MKATCAILVVLGVMIPEGYGLDKLSKSWKHEHDDSIIHLEHTDSDTHHRKTSISVDGKVHFEHHTDEFQHESPNADSAPRLCSPVCDCVLDKNNNCVTDRLKKLGIIGKEANTNNIAHGEL
eukprot:m.105486 g.105486  ORF g.105486 m.105486 type:complete len:122 (+) comp13878_c0_seq3:185-550(+)